MTAYELGIKTAQQRNVPDHLKQAYAHGFAGAMEKRGETVLRDFTDEEAKEIRRIRRGWRPGHGLLARKSSPGTRLLASERMKPAIGGLLGLGVGGVAGAVGADALDSQYRQQGGRLASPEGLMLAIAALGAITGAETGHSAAKERNADILDALRRLPPGATVADVRAKLRNVPGHLKQAYASGFAGALEKRAIMTLPGFLQRDDPDAAQKWPGALNPAAGQDAIPHGIHPNLIDSRARAALLRYIQKHKTDARMRRAYDAIADSIEDQANVYDAKGKWHGLPETEEEAATRLISDEEYKALLTKAMQSLRGFR